MRLFFLEFVLSLKCLYLASVAKTNADFAH